jgi:hypothetical protein
MLHAARKRARRALKREASTLMRCCSLAVFTQTTATGTWPAIDRRYREHDSGAGCRREQEGAANGA